MKESLDIDAPLLRLQAQSALVRMVVKVDPSGKSSQTSFTPLQYYPEKDMTLVECVPYTGRQHQIRVHLFHVKHPIVGDPLYGQSEESVIKYLDKEISSKERVKLSGARRLLLHANELEFDLYGKHYSVISQISFENICFESFNVNNFSAQ